MRPPAVAAADKCRATMARAKLLKVRLSIAGFSGKISLEINSGVTKRKVA
jgi:hypothetical protein